MKDDKTGFFDRIKRLLLPSKCAVCGCIVKDGDCLCSGCLTLWEKEKAASCERCGKSHIKCQCQLKNVESYLSGIHHLSEYKNGSVCKVLVLKIKDKPSEDTIAFLGNELLSLVGERDDFKDAVITFVPRRKEMIIKTGCDQAKELATALGVLCGKNVITALTRKGNKAQKNMNADERKKNIKGAYYLIGEVEEFIKGKRVFLVDDIITTGTTVNYCAEILLTCGAASVSAICVARKT